jgi:release factor glutamine methyltransferase
MVYPKKVYFEDLFFFVDENVYEPAEDSFLLAENMNVTKGDIVLDMGTGCGILAILAAQKTKKVMAIDINPYAITCAIKNAELNCVSENIEFRCGDLFKPTKLGDKFSIILFNSPYLPSEPNEEKSWIGKAWAGGPNGRKVIDRFIIDAPNALTENGKILLIQSSLSDVEKTLERFSENNLLAKIIAKVKVPFEDIVLVEAKL